MANRLDQPNELPLISRKRPMLWCHWPAVEGDRVAVLDENSPEP
jgi:hypothetical protein